MIAQTEATQFFKNLRVERYPFNCQWELTCRCNLKCVMCYTDPFNTPEKIRQELATEEILRILEEIREAGCLEVTFTGGEPFLRRDFLDIYTAAVNKGFLVTIFTNGTLITPAIADHLKTHLPFLVEISIHAATPSSFDAITQGRGSYEHCMEGIQLLLERDIPLMMKTTGMTINKEEIPGIREFVKGLKKVQYKFGADIRAGLDGSEEAIQKFQLPKMEIKDIEYADPDFKAERQKQDREKKEQERLGGIPCAGGKQKFHIDAYGQMQICTHKRKFSYDLRKGSFSEGFYKVLPTFPCRQ